MVVLKRWVAYKIHTEDFLNNEINNNVLVIDSKKIHRVRILGRISNISKSSTIVSFNVDGVEVRDFNGICKEVDEGDLIDVIGKVRTYEGKPYLSLEVFDIKNKDSDKWIELRNLEIEKTRKYIVDEDDNITEDYGEHSGNNINYNELENNKGIDEDLILEGIYSDISIKDTEELKLSILEYIKQNERVSYSDILEKFNIDEDNLDKILDDLITDGEIYEPKAGYYSSLG